MLCVGLGLCAGEMALCVVGYLAAYALCLDSRRLSTRVWSLVPYVSLFVAHRVLYRVLGLGSFGSSGYHDPLQEPGAFLASLAYNLPLLLSAELFAPIADLAFLGDVRGISPAEGERLERQELAPRAGHELGGRWDGALSGALSGKAGTRLRAIHAVGSRRVAGNLAAW